MAKMFYTMEETKAALGRNEEDVKQLAREGRLREFRDGPRLMFKADQVEQLKGELGGGGGDIGMTPTDSGAPLSLADSSSGTGIALSLSDSVGGKPAGKEDTQFADIGLSGSVGGIPSPGRSGVGLSGSGLQGSGMGGGAGGTRAGITVFDVDDASKVDPMAQTAINPGIQEQLSLESVGSGSGLLDLTRESDDTSLGAVFDELTPSAPRRGGAVAPAMDAGEDVGMAAIDRSARGAIAAPIYIEAADPLATALGAASVVAAAVVVCVGFLLGAVLMGYRPEILANLQPEGQLYTYLGGAVGAMILVAIVGYMVGKSGNK